MIRITVVYTNWQLPGTIRYYRGTNLANQIRKYKEEFPKLTDDIEIYATHLDVQN